MVILGILSQKKRKSLHFVAEHNTDGKEAGILRKSKFQENFRINI